MVESINNPKSSTLAFGGTLSGDTTLSSEGLGKLYLLDSSSGGVVTLPSDTEEQAPVEFYLISEPAAGSEWEITGGGSPFTHMVQRDTSVRLVALPDYAAEGTYWTWAKSRPHGLLWQRETLKTLGPTTVREGSQVEAYTGDAGGDVGIQLPGGFAEHSMMVVHAQGANTVEVYDPNGTQVDTLGQKGDYLRYWSPSESIDYVRVGAGFLPNVGTI